jgi:hypothetical protein
VSKPTYNNRLSGSLIFPVDPTIEKIETIVIPLEFRTTLGANQTDFVLHRAFIPNPAHGNRLEGYIVLGDEHILENLFNSTVVATDDTFSIAPPPFTQLTTFDFFFTFCGRVSS